MKNNPLPRLDADAEVRKTLLPFCRLKAGEIWEDLELGHRVGCLNAASPEQVRYLMGSQKASLAIQDPPYNLIAFEERPLQRFVEWCEQWVRNTEQILSADASLYVWLGADQNDGFQPLPDFMMMMRRQPFRARSLITMRNQRGYGTQRNWMAVRQELLYYVKGRPVFNVDAEYTDIPKILRGYYKEVNGQVTENMERGKSENIRAGNVWVDVQQVFYRMEENVSGCYAQKPIKSIDRIIRASSNPGETVVDFFAHSGTTLLMPKSTSDAVSQWILTPCFARSRFAASSIFAKQAAWAGKTAILSRMNAPVPGKTLQGMKRPLRQSPALRDRRCFEGYYGNTSRRA